MKKLTLLMLVAIILNACMSNNHLPTLRFYSWNEYMDESIIKQFEKENHVNIRMEYFANNEEAITKIEQLMKENKGIPPFDVFCPSDYMAEYMKKKDLIEKINIQNMPHVKGNILPFVVNSFDRKREYTVPYAWGSVGILYNTDKIKTPITSWKDVFVPRPEIQGKIFMIDSPKELVGAALKYLGYKFNSTNKAELMKAKEVLMKQSPFVISYNGDAIQEGMPNNEGIMALTWSPEANFAIHKNSHLKFIIPQEGSNLFIDGFVILKGTPQKKLAEKFIDFFYRNDIQKKNWEYMHMSVPSIKFFNSLPEGVLGKTWESNKKTIAKLEVNEASSNEVKKVLYNIYTSIKSS